MKPTICLLAAIIFLASCNNNSGTDPKNQVSSSESENVRVVNQLFEHFNNHEWNKLAELYIDSAEFKDPVYGLAIQKQSRQQIAAHYQELNSFLPDISIRPVHIYPSGDKYVIVEFVSTGSSGPVKIELPICTIFTIEDGKIVKDYTYYDKE